jgi:hypothetical protein
VEALVDPLSVKRVPRESEMPTAPTVGIFRDVNPTGGQAVPITPPSYAVGDPRSIRRRYAYASPPRSPSALSLAAWPATPESPPEVHTGPPGRSPAVRRGSASPASKRRR